MVTSPSVTHIWSSGRSEERQGRIRLPLLKVNPFWAAAWGTFLPEGSRGLGAGVRPLPLQSAGDKQVPDTTSARDLGERVVLHRGRDLQLGYIQHAPIAARLCLSPSPQWELGATGLGDRERKQRFPRGDLLQR